MLTVQQQPIEFSADEIELMAGMEHERWIAQKKSDGWTYGPRSEDRKMHPSLIPYNELEESEKNKDRVAVREIPNLLAAVGIDVVWSGGARETHPGQSVETQGGS